MKIYIKPLDGKHFLLQENKEQVSPMAVCDTLTSALAAKQMVEEKIYDCQFEIDKVLVKWV